MDEAFAFLNVMENEGESPSIVTYSIVIDGLCSDKKLERAKDISDEQGSKSLEPDAVTFNSTL